MDRGRLVENQIASATTTRKGEGMDWLEFASKMFATGIWPAVVATVLYRHREAIDDRIEHLSELEASAKGAKAKFERGADAIEVLARTIESPKQLPPPVSASSHTKDGADKVEVVARVESDEVKGERPSALVLRTWSRVAFMLWGVLQETEGYEPKNVDGIEDAIGSLLAHKVISKDVAELLTYLYSLQHDVAMRADFEPPANQVKKYLLGAERAKDLLGHAYRTALQKKSRAN